MGMPIITVFAGSEHLPEEIEVLLCVDRPAECGAVQHDLRPSQISAHPRGYMFPIERLDGGVMGPCEGLTRENLTIQPIPCGTGSNKMRARESFSILGEDSLDETGIEGWAVGGNTENRVIRISFRVDARQCGVNASEDVLLGNPGEVAGVR